MSSIRHIHLLRHHRSFSRLAMLSPTFNLMFSPLLGVIMADIVVLPIPSMTTVIKVRLGHMVRLGSASDTVDTLVGTVMGEVMEIEQDTVVAGMATAESVPFTEAEGMVEVMAEEILATEAVVIEVMEIEEVVDGGDDTSASSSTACYAEMHSTLFYFKCHLILTDALIHLGLNITHTFANDCIFHPY